MHKLLLFVLVCAGFAPAQMPPVFWRMGNPPGASGTTTIGSPCGPPRYCAYSGQDIRALPSTPDMGGQLATGLVWSDPSLPSIHPPRVVRCTDQTRASGSNGNQSAAAGLGGSGDAEQLWNLDSTLLEVETSGGAHQIIPFNPVTMVCLPAITANKGQDLASPGVALGTSTTPYSFGLGSFYWNDRTKYVGAGGTSGLPAYVFSQYTIDPATLNFTRSSSYLDMSAGYPADALAPAWTARAYAFGDYVSYTLTLLPWSGATSYVVGDLILPGDNTTNPAHCAFKLTTVGTRGTEPSLWSTGTSCTAAQNKAEVNVGCSSAAPCNNWRNIGNEGTFLYQLTSAGGTASSFSVSGHPDLQSTVSDGALTWTNSGVAIVQMWSSFSGLSKDANRFCSAYSSNTYGHPTHYGNDNGGQGTGIFVECFDFATNKFILLNTLTGIESVSTCTGSGYACGGTRNKLTGQGSTALSAITGSCQFELHNAKGGSTLDYIIVARQGSVAGTCPRNSINSDNENLLVWKPFAAYDSALTLAWINGLSNHWTIGKELFVNVGEQTVLGYSSGAYTALSDGDSPAAVPQVSWQVSPCDTSWTAGNTNPPCNFSNAYDSHFAFLHGAADDDTGPVIGTFYNYANLDPVQVSFGQGEEVAVSTYPRWNLGDPIPVTAKLWRFTHNLNSGTNPNFSTQFAISQLSQDGKFLAFSSDWMGSLGTTSGTYPATWGLPWVVGRAYSAGNRVNPFGSTTGSGTNYGVWEVVAPGGTAACSGSPCKGPWLTSADVCTDANAGTMTNHTDAGGVVYHCIGTGNAKGEVFVTELK